MQIQRKHVIVTGLAILSFAAAGAYWQYMKIKDACIKFLGLKLNSVSLDKIDFNITLSLKNPSDLSLDILSQQYVVYLNDKEVVTVTNNVSQTIAKNAYSPITVNIQFNPRSVINILGKNATDILLNREKINVRVEIKLAVKIFGFIPVNIPYTYLTNLKELTAGTPSPTAATPKGKC